MRYTLENMLAVGLALLVTSSSAGHGDTTKSANNPSTASTTSDTMGPAKIMWPRPRKWTADLDNTAPCGSMLDIPERTKFPLKGGKVSLVGQDDHYNVQIGISYSQRPTSNSDFEMLKIDKKIDDLDPGHTCVPLPDAFNDVKAGTNATFQMIYESNWDKPHNQTFYVCSDITFAEVIEVKAMEALCFDANEPGEDNINPPWIKQVEKTPIGKGPSGSHAGADASVTTSKSKLGGGAIAGITIGALSGAVVVAAIALFVYRRGQQKKRKENIARMENAREQQGPMEKYAGHSNA
ncbi:hypothetical protein CDD80_4115 [Ophiocordyceps camponoti-rufipedis]|uniref:Copper acquisition factor BIM1-like domain-containing protein n=1 Tax=Ophiocordyceps camponoti-rufipedis TaxID=2004952 RepID=A0A2C5Z0Z7_9HYPO|nr:hypothetical protein CDD80_4115 [Ophiocordyceps camponoti-rufipedis]